MTIRVPSISEAAATASARRWPELAMFLLCTAVSLSVFLVPMEISAAAYKALAVTVWMILLWIFAPIDHAITGLAGCVLYWVIDGDRKSTRLNSSHGYISYAVFCLKKKKKTNKTTI